MIGYKHLNILKTHCKGHINEKYVQMLVKIKEILNKTTFSYAPKLLVPLYTTYTQHTNFISGPNLVPPRYLDNTLPPLELRREF